MFYFVGVAVVLLWYITTKFDGIAGCNCNVLGRGKKKITTIFEGVVGCYCIVSMKYVVVRGRVMTKFGAVNVVVW